MGNDHFPLAEFKVQVLANLANFAYDPINYEYFRQLNILDLFLGECDNKPLKTVSFIIGSCIVVTLPYT